MTSLLLAALFLAQPSAAPDALDEVNAVRAQRGLPPFQRDEALTQAARGCAHYRASYRISGHTQNDFGFLPAGSRADAAGCAAWHPHMGWGACCTYESYSHAGAAFSYGPDGLRYMHIFVRGQSGGNSFQYTERRRFRRW